MCVRVYVGIDVRTHVSTSLCTHVPCAYVLLLARMYVYVRTYACTFVCMRVRVYLCRYVCMFGLMYIVGMRMYVARYARVYVRKYICMGLCMCVYTHVRCLRTWIRTRRARWKRAPVQMRTTHTYAWACVPCPCVRT